MWTMQPTELKSRGRQRKLISNHIFSSKLIQILTKIQQFQNEKAEQSHKNIKSLKLINNVT